MSTPKLSNQLVAAAAAVVEAVGATMAGGGEGAAMVSSSAMMMMLAPVPERPEAEGVVTCVFEVQDGGRPVR